ncbi:hypothetical protein SUGI_0942140 [Cryptomeria japonica]|nr:hypothetical protein SUGI_0942140 [Cryptomeria japonica]
MLNTYSDPGPQQGTKGLNFRCQTDKSVRHKLCWRLHHQQRNTIVGFGRIYSFRGLNLTAPVGLEALP